MSMGAGDNRSNPVEQDFHRIDSQQAGNSGDMPLLAQDPGTMSSAGASVTMAPAAVEALVSSRNIIPSDMRHSNSPSTTNKNDFKGDKTKNEQNKKGARRPAAAARKPRASQPKNSGLQKKKANLQRDARSKQIEAHNGLQTRGMLESGLSQQISDVALDQNMLERRGAFNAMIAYQEHPGHFNDQNQALGPQSHHLSSHMGHMGHMGNMNQIQQNLPVPNSFPQMGQMKEMQQFYTVSASFPEMNQMNNIQHNSAVSAPFPQMDYNMTAPPLRSYNNMGNGTGEFQGNLLPPRTNHDNPANQQFAMIENSFQSMAMTWNDSNTATLGQISFLNESNPPSFPEQNPGAPQVGRVLHGQATLQFQQPQSQLPQLQPLAAHMFQSEDNQQTNVSTPEWMKIHNPAVVAKIIQINNATSAIANREINNGQPSQPVVSTPSTNGVPPVEPKESLTFFRKWMLAHYVGGK